MLAFSPRRRCERSKCRAKLVIDGGVPLMESLHRPEASVRIVQVGHDPQFQRMLIRGFQADQSIISDPAVAVEALHVPLAGMAVSDGSAGRGEIEADSERRRAQADAAAE